MFKVKKDQLPKRLPQLALVSFIAACSENSSEGLFSFADGFSSRVGGGNPVILPFEAGALSKDESGFTTTRSGGTDSLTIEVEKANKDTTTLAFSNAVQTIDFSNTLVEVSAAGIYKLTTTLDQYDLVVSSSAINKDSGSDDYNKGSIFIFWDVAGIKDETIGGTADATNARLEIKGATTEAYIGTYPPEFLKLGGTDNNYDMIIRSERVDNAKGGIYILWDVAEYAGTTRSITLNNADLTDKATEGSLAIYGVNRSDLIGTYPPEFLKLGGTDNNYDMIIRALVHKTDGVSSTFEGAIYILWDVTAYAGNKTIDLGNLPDADTTPAGQGATEGSLAIYGAKKRDFIGTYAPEFLQLAGKADNYDMVIRSEYVDNAGEGDDGLRSNNTDEGAIYILWDVEDYYSAGTDKNKTIDFATPADATFGLLTIYGKGTNANLGSEDNNVLYNTAGDGNKSLTNIDKDPAGTIDITFKDKDYTYILFGDKVAGTGGDTKVDSKTIDLSVVHASMTADTAGFFSYDFGSGSVDKVGYRFADRLHTNLTEVQTAYDNPSSPLSDADADLGVWDIA